MLAAVCALFLAPVVNAGLAAAAEGATASSTYAAGNLVGSPEFSAANALTSGSGYWCSAGAHSPGETVTFTATLSSARCGS